MSVTPLAASEVRFADPNAPFATQSPLGAREQVFLANPDHPFYFDHPLGHLPGLLLLDMALTAVERGLSRDGGRVWFSRFSAVFRAMGAIASPVTVTLSRHAPTGAHSCALTQGERLVAEAIVEVQAMDPPKAKTRAERTFQPMDAGPVRKARVENVFLADPDATTGRRAVAPASWARGTGFPAVAEGVYRPIYLAEVFLQLCRASRVAETTAMKAAGAKGAEGEGGIPASKEILVHLGGVLPWPLAGEDPLELAYAEADPPAFFPKDPRTLRRVASFFTEDHPVSHFYCDAIQI